MDTTQDQVNTPTHHLTPHGLEMNVIYAKAEQNNSFKTLVPYPCMIFRWARHHAADRMKIAAIASHRLNHHYFCRDKCKIIDTFIKEQTAGMIKQKQLY